MYCLDTSIIISPYLIVSLREIAWMSSAMVLADLIIWHNLLTILTSSLPFSTLTLTLVGNQLGETPSTENRRILESCLQDMIFKPSELKISLDLGPESPSLGHHGPEEASFKHEHKIMYTNQSRYFEQECSAEECQIVSSIEAMPECAEEKDSGHRRPPLVDQVA